MWVQRLTLGGFVCGLLISGSACERPHVAETDCMRLLTDEDDAPDRGALFAARTDVPLPEDAELDAVRTAAVLWGFEQDPDASVYCVGLEGDRLPSGELLTSVEEATPAPVVASSECVIGADGVTHGEARGVFIDVERICVESQDRMLIEISVFHGNQGAFGTHLDVTRDGDGEWSVVDTFFSWIS